MTGQIKALADRSHGVVRGSDIERELRLDRSGIRHRVRQGLLQPLYQGVYVWGSNEPSLFQRRLGATMSARESYLYGMTLINHVGFGRFAAEKIEVVSPHQHRIEGYTQRRSGLLVPEHLAVHDDIPGTTVARAIVDVARHLAWHQVANIIDAAGHARWLDLAALRDAIRYLRHCPGATGAARALDEHLAGGVGTRSWLEDKYVE